jgi:hypothetical protein
MPSMKTAPLHRDDEMGVQEFLLLPEATRLAIVKEHRYRKRPATSEPPPAAQPDHVAPMAAKAVGAQPAAALDATRGKRQGQASPAADPKTQRFDAAVAEWKRGGPALRERYDSFTAFFAAREITAAPNPGALGGADTAIVPGEDPTRPLEERIAASWEASGAIRQEFGSRDVYAAWRRGEARLQGRIHRGRVTSMSATDVGSDAAQ